MSEEPKQPTPPAEEKPPTVKRKLLLVGLEIRYGDSMRPKELFSKWYDVTDLVNDGRDISEAMKAAGKSETKLTCHYSEKLAKGLGRPGMIWEFECPDDTHVYPSTAKVVGRWKNDDDTARWQVRHDAQRRAWELTSEAKREASRNLPMEGLKPFRDAYRNLDCYSQGVLLSQVCAYIAGGKIPDREPAEKKPKKK